ncbi:MAG: hypothetical protein II839_00735 [Kiritimatiellae bacterium]|nr:hypothetical protein [Kiritimatiellia bacterium]
MGTLLKVLTVFILLLSIFALVLGIANFNKREQLIGRTHELESSIIALANFIEDRLPNQAGRTGTSDEDDEDDEEGAEAAAPAAAEPAADVEHVAWDVDQVDSEPNDAPAMCDFWETYPDRLETTDYQTINLGTRERKDQLATYFVFDWVDKQTKRASAPWNPLHNPGENETRQVRVDSFDRPLTSVDQGDTAHWTMHNLLKDMQDKAKYQLAELGATRNQLRVVRETLEEVAGLLNEEKKLRRENLQEIVKLNKKIDELNGIITQKDLEIARLEREKSELQDRITALEEEVAKKDQDLQEANTLIEQQKEQIRRLTIELQGTGKPGTGFGSGKAVKLTPGPKGKIAKVNAEEAFVIVELTPEAAKEIIPDGQFPAPVEMMVHRKGPDGEDLIVTRIRIIAPPNSENLAIADNVYGWQQTDTIEVGDEVIY